MAQDAKRNPDGSFKYKRISKTYGRGRRQRTVILKQLDTSTVSKRQSERMLDDFTAGDYDVMIATVGKAGEGVDIPIVDNVVIADGGKSYVETMQKQCRHIADLLKKYMICSLCRSTFQICPTLFQQCINKAQTLLKLC